MPSTLAQAPLFPRRLTVERSAALGALVLVILFLLAWNGAPGPFQAVIEALPGRGLPALLVASAGLACAGGLMGALSAWIYNRILPPPPSRRRRRR